MTTKIERNQEQNRKKPSTLIEDSIPLAKAQGKSIGNVKNQLIFFDLKNRIRLW